MKTILITVFAALAGVFWWMFIRRPQAIKTVNELRSSYDYIIVGAGTAGSVLAARLSEDPNLRILLLEAGDIPPFIAHVPGYVGFLQNTKLDWKYRTVSQKHACKSMTESKCAWPRGKVLGGSSMLNYMQYTRGPPADYDYWASLGNKGWSYKDVLPYFKKSEDMTIPSLRDSAFHGRGGPVKVERSFAAQFANLVIESAKLLGYPTTEDYNSDAKQGFSVAQLFVSKGIRQSGYTSFLKPAFERTNLDILVNAHVTQIKFDGNRATGIKFVWNDQRYDEYFIKSDKEILISAGAIGSPHLLMLSGIGPKKDLDSLGIPVIRDLPVGENLQDHVMTDLNFMSDESLYETDWIEFQTTFGQIKAALDYILNKAGPFSKPINDVSGFIYTGLSSDPRPDLEFIISPLPAISEPIYHNFNLKYEVAVITYYDFMSTCNKSRFHYTSTFLAMLSHPRSRGKIQLVSRSPFDYPLIDPKYFEDQRDVETIRQGLKIALNISRAAPFKKYNYRYGEQPLRECKKFEILSDDYLDCLIRHRTLSTYHHACTCRMGRNEKDSVVNSEFKVHGVEALRVIDASAFPDQVSGNTNAPVIMIAEKASDIILGKRTL